MNLRDKVLEYQLNIKDGPAFNSNFKLLLESWEKSAGKSLGERGGKSLKKKTSRSKNSGIFSKTISKIMNRCVNAFSTLIQKTAMPMRKPTKRFRSLWI